MESSHSELWPAAGLKGLRQTRALIRADLYRYAGCVSARAFLRHFLFTPGFKYTVWLRWSTWSRRQKLTKFTLYPVIKWRLLHNRYKFGIAIPEGCRIGPGLFINRFGGIYIHHDAVIGTNVNITHGTVLGYLNRGRHCGAPTIGNRVFLGSGAKVMGAVEVGDDAMIGVSAVVTGDVPEGGVAFGVPAAIISAATSSGYINRQVSEAMISATGWTRAAAPLPGPVAEIQNGEM